MEKFKRTWLFWLVMFAVPIIAILVLGFMGHQIQLQINNDAVTFQFGGEYLRSILYAIATSLIAAGIVYLFIDKKLKELLQTDDEITVILKSPHDEVACPPMSRKDFSRAEVMGYIGMLHGSERFLISSTKTRKFGEDIRKIKKGEGNQNLIVECTDEEIKPFLPGYKKDKDEIRIILQSEDDAKKKYLSIDRNDFNRAEILGRIGMLSIPERFSIKSLKSPEFFEQIQKVKGNKNEKELVVTCTNEEIKQFIVEEQKAES